MNTLRLRTKLTTFPLLIMLAIGLVACEQKTTRKLLRYNSTVVSATEELQRQATDAYSKKELGVDEVRGIVTGTTQVLQVSKELNDVLAQITEWTPDNRAQVLNLVTQISDSVRQLNQDGVLRIKNDETRAALNKTLIAIEAALSAAGEVLQ